MNLFEIIALILVVAVASFYVGAVSHQSTIPVNEDKYSSQVNSTVVQENTSQQVIQNSSSKQEITKNSSTEEKPVASVDLGELHYLVKNGNSDEKLDLLFIPVDIDNKTLFEQMNKALYSKGVPVNNVCGTFTNRSLFYIEPFKTYASKINIEYMDKKINFTEFNCHYSDRYTLLRKRTLSCDDAKIRKAYAKFKPDRIILIGDSYETTGGQVIRIGNDANRTFVHELGHSLGGLTDEYVYAINMQCNNETGCSYSYPPDECINSPNPNCFESEFQSIKVTPNEDVIGCPKWCSSYNKTKLEQISKYCTDIKDKEECMIPGSGCIWFNQVHPWFNAHCIPTQLDADDQNIGINCTDNAGCFFGVHFVHASFVPSCKTGGMMQNIVGGFNTISKQHMEKVLKCCYPPQHTQECKEFAEQFQNLPTNTILPFAYQQFQKCYKE